MSAFFSIPIADAVVCEDCKTISPRQKYGVCGVCGSNAVSSAADLIEAPERMAQMLQRDTQSIPFDELACYVSPRPEVQA